MSRFRFRPSDSAAGKLATAAALAAPQQRERLEEPEFYEMLQREIGTRLLKLPTDP